ncbi:MAG: BatA domain-containing protein, partial [Muribaculaceae bacterium]|nr:BatA domain-containing protein [Muribaculaceae bacterium]
MFSFAYPKLLMLLLLVPAFVALYAWARYARARNLRKFGKPRVLAPLMPEVSPYKPPIKITLQMLALALIVIAFARPWGGVKDEKTVKEGIE